MDCSRIEGNFCSNAVYISPPAKVKVILDPNITEDARFMTDILFIDHNHDRLCR